MDWKHFLFSFEGRIGRARYWMFTLAIIVIFAVLAVMGGVSAPTDPAAAPAQMNGMLMVIVVLALAVIWPSLAVQAKRWHDVDKSAWWILIGLVPAVGGLIALVFNGFIGGTPGPNRFGPPAA
ncbi:MAG: DUF805 domain-containing protein [Dokdonella sp.]